MDHLLYVVEKDSREPVGIAAQGIVYIPQACHLVTSQDVSEETDSV